MDLFAVIWVTMIAQTTLCSSSCTALVNEQCWDNSQTNVSQLVTTNSVWTSGGFRFWSMGVMGDCRAYVRTAKNSDGTGESSNHVIESNSTTPFYLFCWNCPYLGRVTRQPALVVTGNPNLYVVEVRLQKLTRSPTSVPTFIPTLSPTIFPTETPTIVPSSTPTHNPSFSPSFSPSMLPSFFPSTIPSRSPSTEPTSVPSASPTTMPSQTPSRIPTAYPSTVPTLMPTFAPTQPCNGTLTVFSISDNRWDGVYDVFDGNGTRPFFKTGNDQKTIKWNNSTTKWEITYGNDVISFGYIPPSSAKNFWPPREAPETWTRNTGGGSVEVTLTCRGEALDNRRGFQQSTVDILAQLRNLGFYLPLSMFGLAFVTVLVAYVYQKCHPGSDSIRWISCFRYFLQVFDLVTDVLFAYQLLALGMFDLFIASGTFIIVPYLLSFFMLGYLIHQWRGIDSGSVSEFLQKYDWVLFFFCAMCGGCHAAVSLANSKMFFHKFFNMGLRRHDLLRMGKWKLWSTTLTENIPQVVIQTIYFVRVGVLGDFIGIAAFAMTFVSLVMTVATQLTRCTRKDELLWTDGLHFLLMFQSSKLRGWHKFSEKNMAYIVSRYLGIPSSRVEIYDAHIMGSTGTRGLRYAGVVGGLLTTLGDLEQDMGALDTNKDKFVGTLITWFGLGDPNDNTIIENLKVEWMHIDSFEANSSISSLGERNIQMRYWDELHSTTSSVISLESPKAFAAARAKNSLHFNRSGSESPTRMPDPEMKPRERMTYRTNTEDNLS